MFGESHKISLSGKICSSLQLLIVFMCLLLSIVEQTSALPNLYNQPEMTADPVVMREPVAMSFSQSSHDVPPFFLQNRNKRNAGDTRNENDIKGKEISNLESCPSEYRAIAGHTMCFTDHPNLVASGMSEQDKALVVNKHNFYRGNVLPPATDLPKMIWDDRLAAVAEKWAKQCIMGHDSVREIPGYGRFIGQNVAGGYRDWQSVIKAWYEEIELYRYGVDPVSYLGEIGWKKIGHFTQMVYNTSILVGCGYAKCSGTKYGKYYVCDYLTSQSRIGYPYTKGDRCSACPDTCINGICDCAGKFCHHGGTLNLNTCQCTCESPYTGDQCTELFCPPKDPLHCTSQWNPSYCTRFVNVPLECPYMCGPCSEENKKIYQTLPNGSVLNGTNGNMYVKSIHGCEYYGKRPNKETCRTLGNSGQDTFACETNGGASTCTDCERFTNIPREYCPVMCGLCDAPCVGKVCENGGTLNTGTCECTCEGVYSGDRCQTVNCPESDKWYCGQWPQSYCQTYMNVPKDCPYKCGLCTE